MRNIGVTENVVEPPRVHMTKMHYTVSTWCQTGSRSKFLAGRCPWHPKARPKESKGLLHREGRSPCKTPPHPKNKLKYMRGPRQGIYTYRYVAQEAANYCIQGRQTHFWKTFYSLRGAWAILLAAIRSSQRNNPTTLLPFHTRVRARSCPRDSKRQRPYQFGCKETGLFCFAPHAPQPVQPRRSRKQVIRPKLQIIPFSCGMYSEVVVGSVWRHRALSGSCWHVARFTSGSQFDSIGIWLMRLLGLNFKFWCLGYLRNLVATMLDDLD